MPQRQSPSEASTRPSLERVKPSLRGSAREMTALEEELRAVINRCSAENGSDTPDFLLAGYLVSCLEAFDVAVRQREIWYGRGPKPVDPPSSSSFE